MPTLPPDIQEILKKAENRQCADCKARDPKWASVSIGIIICESCAGIHRNLGTHISKVKSTSLDTWKPEWISTVKAVGNARAAAFYEHSVPEEERYKGSAAVSQGDKLNVQEGRKLERWIRDKYEHLKYKPPDLDEPRKRLERGEQLDDGPPGGGAAKEEKHHRRRSRKKASDASASPVNATPGGGTPAAERSFSEAFAALGEWAAEPDVDGRAASESRHKKKKEKKEKREGSRRRHSSRSSADGLDGMAAAAEEAASPGHEYTGADWAGQWGGPGGATPGPSAQPSPQPPAYGGAAYGGEPYGGPQQPSPYGGDPYGGLQQQQQQLASGGQGCGLQQGCGGMPGAATGERRRALMSIARLYQTPEVLGLAPGVGASLLPLHGFDLQAAEFLPTALRRPRAAPAPQAAEAWELELSGGRPRGETQALERDTSMSKLRSETEVSLLQDELKKIRSEMKNLRDDYREIKEEGARSRATTSDLEGSRSRVASAATWDQDGSRSRGVSVATWDGQLQTVPQSPRGGGREDDPDDWWVRGAGGPAQAATPPLALPAAGPTAAFSTVSAAAELGFSNGTFPQASAGVASPNVSALPPADVTGPDLAWAAGGMDSPGSYPPQTVGGADTGSREVLGRGGSAEQPPQLSGVCYIDRDAFAKYAHFFRQLDENQDNIVEGRDVRVLFDQSMLDPSELKLIWAICDTSRIGRLTLEEFACAMHLVFCRRQGTELPLSLPAELSNSVRHLAAEYRATAPPPAAPAPAPPASWGAGGCVEPGGAEAAAGAEGAGWGSPWEVNAEELERYRSTYASLDAEGAGSIGPMEAKELLEKTNLPTAELSQIWQMSDVDLDSRLSLGELVCAMHLATRRLQGLPLPDTLPPELAIFASGGAGASLAAASPVAEAAAAAAEPPASGQLPARGPGLRPELPAEEWQGGLSEEELAEIWHLSDADGDGRLAYNDFVYAALLLACKKRGLELSAEVGREEALAILEQSQLPSAELSRIWGLADADRDGQLNFGSFSLALHLALRRLQGGAEAPFSAAPPPAAPPPPAPLAEGPADASASSMCPQPSWEPAPGFLEEPPSSPWAITPQRVRRYRTLFEGLPRQEPETLRQEEVRDTLGRSGLPREDLAHIWQLADADEDGLLTFGEFACALHLAAGRRQGLELPPALPPELAHMAQLADALGGGAGPGGGGAGVGGPGDHDADSPWAVLPDQLERYGEYFDGLQRTEAGTLGPQEAVDFMSRSQLPHGELMHALQLSDLNGDGQLTFEEFACAMHLVTLRCQGLELPAELPHELLASLPGSWVVSDEQLRRYWGLFQEAAGGPGAEALAAEAAWEVLERSALPRDELSQIVRLAGAGAGGQLTPGAFACALHLAARCRQGAALPAELPAELAGVGARMAAMG